MTIEPTLGDPKENGIYAARQWYCWRILEWKNGAWWHEGGQAPWPKSAPIEAHVGPLPRIAQRFPESKSLLPAAKPAPLEFDL